MFYTYVLLSEKDMTFYTGFTRNLKQRMEDYAKGSVIATRDRRSLRLIYYGACIDERDALKREKYFKAGFGRRFLRNRLEYYLKRSR